jgi:hypothetical protein
MIYSFAGMAVPIYTPGAGVEIVAAATHSPKIMSLSVTYRLTSTNQFMLGKPAAAGTEHPSAPSVQMAPEDDPTNPSSLTRIRTRWGTAPTVPTNFFRRATLDNNGATGVGAGFLWHFQRGLALAAGGTLVLWVDATIEKLFNFEIQVSE